jgi:hypothetical protein
MKLGHKKIPPNNAVKYLRESTKNGKVGKKVVWAQKVAPATYRQVQNCHVR